MDPRNGVPDEPNDERPQAGEAEDGTLALPRAQRQPLVPPTADLAASAGSSGTGGGSARVVQLVAGDFLLTLNPVDGSEITTCPPEDRPVPVRRAPQERAARQA
ncbi:MAG: hypothetical protein QOF44_4806, partial [Streptomyces sp.]|nr:hypothetical protein [Streptomyces sp.]